jgi:cytochrome c peroxidase
MRLSWIAAVLAIGPAACSSRSTAVTPVDGGHCASADVAAEAGIAVNAPLPPIAFAGDGPTPTPLSTYAEPCALRSRVLLVRNVAGWCGPCRWHAANTQSMVPSSITDRVRVVDLLLADDDNAPPAAGDRLAWATRAQGAVDVFLDPDFQLRALFPAHSALPLVAVIDARTLTPLEVLSSPSPDAVAQALVAAVAQVDGTDAAAPPAEVRFDGRFTGDQWAMIADMQLAAGPPADSTNRVADDPRAAALGEALFFDQALSPYGVSCSSCHVPSLLFTEGKGTPPEGAGAGSRNVPSIILASYQRWQLWDGRADSLWMQALLPMEAANEFGSSRLFVMHDVFDEYKADYEILFGPMPPLLDAARFPPSGMPGDPTWSQMAPDDATAVTRAFVNVGKAIAAYERSLRVAPNALDAYASGDLAALTTAQKDGLQAFFAAGCAQCHYGPRLTDDAFHDLRFPTGRPDLSGDPGRAAGIPLLLASSFLESGAFSDAPIPAPTLVVSPAQVGAFKTPGLRGVPFTMPYGHGGSFGGLTSTLDAHRTGGLDPASPLALGDADPFLVAFDPALTPAIETFLATLELNLTP